MRKIGSKFGALFLCVACLISGCSGSEKKATPEPGSTTQSSVESQENRKEKKEEETEEKKEENYVQPEMKGEITISSFMEQEFLRAAAKEFMDQYPDVTVTINVYSESAKAGDLEDYQTYLNTKLMTGKAEDIIFNTFLPITKYSEMGAFEDLSRYISSTPELNEENYFMNILLSAKEESGKVYIIPYMAKFDVLGFSTELLEERADIKEQLAGWESAGFTESMNLARQLIENTNKGNAFLIQMNEVPYMDYLMKGSMEQFVDVENKKVNIDSEEYIGLLKLVNELSEKGYIGTEVDFYNTEYYFAVTKDYDVQAAFYALDAKAGMAYSMPLADQKGNVSINTNGCLALNSASENKDLAWEFIRFLLSEEVQSLPSVHGLAVNRQGFEASVERYYNFYGDKDKGNGFVEKEDYRNLLENWMEQINACDTLDLTILNLIDQENGKYFSGEQTAEETAKRLQKQINQYFNE